MKAVLSKEHLLFLQKQKRRKVLVLLAQIGTLVVLLALWELLAQTGVIDAFITSCPSRIWATFVELVADGTLLHHAWVSTLETLAGFAIGTILGYVVAVILWWNNFLKDVFEPYIVVLNSLPKIALGPIIIIWAGTGKASIITMAATVTTYIGLAA